MGRGRGGGGGGGLVRGGEEGRGKFTTMPRDLTIFR